ncbi:50S ribosomal protein L6, chloroplastic [Vitis vinifera]|uniref:50S ribosomal protein L6, chloroplastic n=1 Tax=Vitis vinifera TaxID=29760 RepID=A0A438EFG4_VITVI|nr:50S ribosomal protein L6, chloroplastic [Vitis vinifera]
MHREAVKNGVFNHSVFPTSELRDWQWGIVSNIEILETHFDECRMSAPYSNLRSAFLGERNGIYVSSVPVTRVGFLRKTIECKESRIGKKPIEVPSNVTITLEGQDLKVKGPLGSSQGLIHEK